RPALQVSPLSCLQVSPLRPSSLSAPDLSHASVGLCQHPHSVSFNRFALASAAVVSGRPFEDRDLFALALRGDPRRCDLFDPRPVSTCFPLRYGVAIGPGHREKPRRLERVCASRGATTRRSAFCSRNNSAR